MRFLRRRELGAAPTEPRVVRLTVIRWIYIAAVALLALFLFDLFFGSLFVFRSEGLVVGPPAVVAAEYPFTVARLLVNEGDEVKAGQTTAKVSSQHVAETIAKLTADVAARQVRLSDLRIRSQVVDALLPMAQHRQEVASKARRELERLLSTGNTALNQRTAAVELEYQATKDFETLKAEKNAVTAEMGNVNVALDEAQKAIADLRRLFDEGRLRSPIDGIISRRLASNGSVLRAGDPLFELYGAPRFVYAYLPTGGLYVTEPGDKVTISSGLQSYRGHISRIEPFAAALPQEFQRAFTPIERQQVLRVEFDPGQPPPALLTKVRLTEAGFVPGWLKYLYRRLWPEAECPPAGAGRPASKP